MKIDRRIKYRLVLDTETCPCDSSITEVKPDNMLVYDIGWAIVDKRGKVYKTSSYVVKEIFFYEKKLMCSAYYSSKIPKYLADIKNKSRVADTFYNIRQAILKDIADYDIDEIYAHNMRFDLGSLNNTFRWLTKSKYRYFFPSNCDICDTLQMARQVVAPTPTYKKFCKANGYLTRNNQVRLTAEILYRYITKDNEFIESHTGLEDVLIEKEIMRYCFAKHKKMNRILYPRKVVEA